MLHEPAQTDVADVPEGSTLLAGRYRLNSLVGVGASARVYRAKDETLGRAVAVKILHPALAQDPQFRRRFETEARHAAAMNHPNLLAIYDWADGGEVYIVTELLTGGSLRHLLDTGERLSPSQALLIGLEAAHGLAHAHAEGFVHRDIKPANLLFDAAGRLSVADFGIARAVAEASWTEPEGALIGTARYAAPEQALGRGVDGKADVYALALTVIEAVTGEVPLVGANPLATMVLRQDHDVEVPDTLGPLQPILAAAALASPDARPSADRFIAQLEATAGQLPRPAPLPLAGLQHHPVGKGSLGSDPMINLTSSPATHAVVLSVEADPTTPMSQPTPLPDPIEDPPVNGPYDDDAGADPLGLSQRSRRWPWVVALLVVLIAGAAALDRSGVVDGIFPDPVPEVITYPVGTFVGRDIADVERDVAASSWVASVSSTRSDDSIVGEVLTQSPAPGVQLEEGGVVILVVSEGPLLHEAPVLVGLTLEEAEVAAAGADLQLGQIERSFDEDEVDGVVLSTSVVAGTELETGALIDIVVSAGPEPRVVPALAGRSRADAESALIGLGLVPIVAEDFSTDVASGLVIRVDPGVDTTVPRGGEVTVVISKGLPFITVPDVVNMSAAEAADALAAAGLVVTDTNGPPNKKVLATDPQAGESVRLGTGVIIFTKR